MIDVAPDLEWTTVAIATDGPDGEPLGLVDRHEGTGWVIKWDAAKKKASGRIPQLLEDMDKVLEIALTPTAWMFYDKLLIAGIDKDTVKKLTASEVGQACMATQKMISNGEASHVGQGELEKAARAAITKLVGETQQWDRRNNKVDISPLVAWSTAIHRWALTVATMPKKVPVPRRKPKDARDSAPVEVTRRVAEPVSRGQRPPASRPRRTSGSGFNPRTSGF